MASTTPWDRIAPAYARLFPARPAQVGFLAAACLSLFALGLGALILGTA